MPILIVRGDWDEFEDSEDREAVLQAIEDVTRQIAGALQQVFQMDVVTVDGEPCVEYPVPSLRLMLAN